LPLIFWKTGELRVLLELPGNADVKTTEIYVHAMSRDIRKLQILFDVLPG
jgi:site-specific recombinase XerD